MKSFSSYVAIFFRLHSIVTVTYVCVCLYVSYCAENGADDVEDNGVECSDAALSQLCHNAGVSSLSSSGASRHHRLTRSTSDKAPRSAGAARHQRSVQDDPQRSMTATTVTAGGVTQRPIVGERATLPRVGRDVENSPRALSDVWLPMNSGVPFKDFTSQSNSVERAARAGVDAEGSCQRKLSTKSPIQIGISGSFDDQPGMWSETVSSPWEICHSVTQSAGRPTSVQTTVDVAGKPQSNYGKLDYCNSLTQTPQTPGTLSRSWFDMERPQTRPTSPMSSSALGLPCLRQSTSTDADKSRAGTITETKTVCSICSSEAFVTERGVEIDAGRSDEWSQAVALSRGTSGYRCGGGGSLPRMHGGQRACEPRVTVSASSMPRGLSMSSAVGSAAVVPAAVPVSSALSSTSSSDHSAVLTTSSADNDVRTMICPSPKRSLSSRDDECKQLVHLRAAREQIRSNHPHLINTYH